MLTILTYLHNGKRSVRPAAVAAVTVLVIISSNEGDQVGGGDTCVLLYFPLYEGGFVFITLLGSVTTDDQKIGA